jgi:membrane fusion protein, copper/silver efflux system
MKKNLKNKISWRSILAATILALLMACSKEGQHEHRSYTCPMHPTVVSDKPGSCPVCGMDLVLKDNQSTEAEVLSKRDGDVVVSTNEAVISSVKTIKGEFKTLPVMYEAQGIVTYDTRNIFTISSRVSGRLEKVYLKYPYQNVSKGQKVAEIYSPELLTAQRELIFLLQTEPMDNPLTDAAVRKLSLLGMTEAQINSLAATRTVKETYSIFSPYSGYLITNEIAPGTPSSAEEAVASSSGNGMAGGMNGESGDNSTPASIDEATRSLVKEGNYISAGGTLFRIINNSSLRIELEVPATQASGIRKGDKLQLDFGTGEMQTATIEFIQPFLGKNEDFIKIRVTTKYLPELHIGHLLKATIKAEPVEAMWIPRESVVDLGKEKVVFVKATSSFKPKPVKTGIFSGDNIQVLHGLTSSDEIAANAQFLVDSESIIKPQE